MKNQVKVEVVPVSNGDPVPDVIKPVRPNKRCKGPLMGAGTKYDFTKGNRYNAGPASYTIPTVFDIGKFKNSGAKFRNGRKVISVENIESRPIMTHISNTP